jgi:murein DD-endopeptidase MepM/ murein hydrolase activator NlpD
MKHKNYSKAGLVRNLSVFASLVLLAGSAQATVLFRLPLAVDTTTHYYYDHNGASGAIDDWKCGSATYDGHHGSDFSGGPRGTAIYAAAVGTLGYRIDGFGDGYRGSPDGGGFGNYVRLQHAEGMTTYYGHMTVGSVTTKAVGSGIACGERVGGVGTSGSSTGLHLHFEPRINGTADDPFSGSCGGPISWWVNQNGGHPVTTCQGSSGGTTVTVDNSNGGFSVIGTWATSSSSTDKLGADYRYHSAAAVSEPATWSASLTAGTYAVYAWWPQGSNRSTTSPYIVNHSGGSTTKNMNQQINGGKWNLLGTWAMAGGANSVKLSCWTGTGFIVVADGVRWVSQ